MASGRCRTTPAFPRPGAALPSILQWFCSVLSPSKTFPATRDCVFQLGQQRAGPGVECCVPGVLSLTTQELSGTSRRGSPFAIPGVLWERR